MKLFVDEGTALLPLLKEMTQHREMAPFINRIKAAIQDREGRTNRPNGKQRIEPNDSKSRENRLVEPLSEREFDVLRLFRTELSGPEIARELVVALSTVRTHTKGIYRKLGVNSRRAAVKRAEELNLL